jgi:hypothetical protein
MCRWMDDTAHGLSNRCRYFVFIQVVMWNETAVKLTSLLYHTALCAETGAPHRRSDTSACVKKHTVEPRRFPFKLPCYSV